MAQYRRWQLQEAKAKLSEMVSETLATGPQVITLRGKDAVAMVPMKQLKKLERSGRKKSLIAVMRSCPYPLTELNIARDRTDFGRAAPDFSGE